MKFDAKSHTYYCDYTPAADDTKVKFTSGSVTWATDMKSLNSGDSMYYTAYGDHNNSNAGYGTWGEVIEISVSSKTADVLPDTGNVSSVYMVPDKMTLTVKLECHLLLTRKMGRLYCKGKGRQNDFFFYK